MTPAQIFLKHMPRLTKHCKVREQLNRKKKQYEAEEQSLVKELRELRMQSEARKQELNDLRLRHVGIL